MGEIGTSLAEVLGCNGIDKGDEIPRAMVWDWDTEKLNPSKSQTAFTAFGPTFLLEQALSALEEWNCR